MKTGKIKYFDDVKHIGFIIEDDHTNEYFFHINNCIDKNQQFKKDDSVKFNVQKSKIPGKKDIAINIELVQRKEIINDNPMEYFKNNVLEIDYSKYDEFCDYVKVYAEKLKAESVTTSMIRNVYSKIVASKEIKDLKVLRPRFAYIAGRNEKNKVLREFMELLDNLVKKIEQKEHVDNFKQFMEAVVAYRKYAGKDQ